MNHWPASSSAAAALEDEPLLAKRKMKTLSIKQYLARLETSHEPGLTNAQLMLTNDDLKPGRNLYFLLSSFPPKFRLLVTLPWFVRSHRSVVTFMGDYQLCRPYCRFGLDIIE